MRNYRNPISLMVITTICVFVAEALIMVLLTSLPQLSSLTLIFIDATLIVICVLPVLYFSLFRPLQQTLKAKIKSEKELSQSEFLLLEAQKVAHLGYYIFDLHNDSWISSKVLDNIFGMDKNYKRDIDGWLDIIHPDFKENMKNYLQEDILKKHKQFDKEYKIINQITGIEKWVHGLGSLKFDNDGNPIEMFGTIQDISERKKVEEALKEVTLATSAQQGTDFFESMAKQLSQAIGADYTLIGKLKFKETPTIQTIALTVDGKIFDNIEYNLLDTPGANVIGKQICSYKSGVSELFPNDGILKQMNVEGYVGVPLFDSKHNASGILVALFRDPISDLVFKEAILQMFSLRIESELERSKTVAILKESEEKYRLIFETAANLILSVDSNGNFVDCNNKIEDVLGYKRDEIIGKNMTMIIHPDFHERAIEAISTLIETGISQMREFKMVRKDGIQIYININSSSLTDKDGEFVRSICIIDDITETKRLQELESRASRLEMAGTIAGQVAHDFNNLLAPIMIYPEFIHEVLPDGHKAHSFLNTIEESAKKIADINQDLLTMGRRGHYNLDVVNINKIILQAVKEMKARSEKILCETNLAENLLNIKGGSAQIHRMVTNILVNATDAMQDIGTIFIKTENFYADNTSIAFGIVPKGEYVKLTIADSGCGIPKEIIQKILDPFFSTKRADKKSGSGLGMSVVDTVMKDHNGYLDLQSIVDVGTSFYFYFPITRDSNNENQSDTIEGGTERILVVDDDDVQRDVSTRLLTKLGYKVSSTKCGEDAVDFLKNNPQDLILLDMIMPAGIDGTETYQQMLNINPNQKAIIVSGFSETDRVKEAQELGVGAFLKKPFTKQSIANAVRKELDRTKEVLSHVE